MAKKTEPTKEEQKKPELIELSQIKAEIERNQDQEPRRYTRDISEVENKPIQPINQYIPQDSPQEIVNSEPYYPETKSMKLPKEQVRQVKRELNQEPIVKDNNFTVEKKSKITGLKILATGFIILLVILIGAVGFFCFELHNKNFSPGINVTNIVDPTPVQVQINNSVTAQAPVNNINNTIVITKEAIQYILNRTLNGTNISV